MSTVEEKYVHAVYEQIADHFSDTRYKPWPKVEAFIKSLPTGSVLLDIGCGNGKYLGVNKSVAAIGCDRSSGLVAISASRGYQAVVGDCIETCFRPDCADAVVCVAVVHHMATPERRLTAIRSLAQLVRRGGRVMVTVWAFEQKNTSYLKTDKESESDRRIVDGLEVHRNRTQFSNQDMLVPWKSRGGDEGQKNEECLRYYHLFVDGELKSLVEQLDNVEIIEHFYDDGNWCVIFEKT